MPEKTKLIKISLFLILLLVVFAFGRYSKKTDTITQIKTIEVIKEVKVKDLNVNQQNNKQIHTVITEYPDGTKTTEIFEINKDTIVLHEKEIIKKEETKQEEKIKITTVYKPQWLLSGGYGRDFDSDSNVLSIGVSKRLLGPVFVGISAISNKTLMGQITLEF